MWRKNFNESLKGREGDKKMYCHELRGKIREGIKKNKLPTGALCAPVLKLHAGTFG